jgi:hypothetical protein
MIYLGEFTIDDYIPIIVQAHDTSGSAADLDSGSFNLDFYEIAYDTGTWAAMTTPDTTLNTKLDSKTGLYAGSVQATAANGFEAGKFYALLIGSGTIDSQTPATLITFCIRADGQRPDEVATRIMTALPAESVATAANLATVDGIVDKLDTAMEADGAVYRFTTNALELAPSAGINPATQIDGGITWAGWAKLSLAREAGKKEIDASGQVNHYQQDGNTIAIGLSETSNNLRSVATINWA